MHSFKTCGKVRNKVTGHVATFGEIIFDGRVQAFVNDGEHDLELLWNPEHCEPYYENQPVMLPCDKSKMPTKIDEDLNGRIMFKYVVLETKSVSWDFIGVRGFLHNCAKPMTDVQYLCWMHTPDWKPLEPLPECCGDCDHVGYEGIDRGSTVCWKHCTFSPKPHYKSGIPCHLAEKDNVETD